MSSPESPRVPNSAASGENTPIQYIEPKGVREEISARAPGAIPQLPWMSFAVGERIVIRYRLADGLHDALGEALEVAPTHVTVATRRGPVRVDARTMVTGKRVPPPPAI